MTRVLPIVILLVAISGPAFGADGAEPSSYAVEPLLAEIRSRMAQLDRRERDLTERERTHTELEALTVAQLEEVTELRETMKRRIAAWEKESGKRISRLAKIYEAMKPVKAARLLDALDANLATQIIAKMKHKKSAAVIERISQVRALTVSRQVAYPLSFDPAAEETGGT